MHLLEIEVSPRQGPSVSRSLGEQFTAEWSRQHPGSDVTVRDLAQHHPSFVDGPWIDAAFTRDEHRTDDQRMALAESDNLIGELTSADRILISTPMFNFGLPASLKAYFDQIVRIGVTYARGGGLLPDTKTTVICASRDLYTPGAPTESADHFSSHLREILRYVGIRDVEIILVGDSIAVRDGRITFDEHIAEFEPEVIAAVGA